MARENLEALPIPKIIEELSFDEVFESILQRFRSFSPNYTSIVEGDPAYAVLQVAAYREVSLRQRINDSIRAVLVPFSVGSDLDNLAIAYGVYRRIITQADPTANPPVEAVVESDESLRDRILGVFESITPGSKDWYERLAVSVDPNIREAQAVRGTAGAITVYVQSEDNDGTPTDTLVAAVRSVLQEDSNRFFGDVLTISKVTPVSYTITAQLTISAGAIAADVVESVEAQIEEFCNSARRIGVGIPISAIWALLNQDFVESTVLTSPTASIAIMDGQIPVCGTVTITTT